MKAFDSVEEILDYAIGQEEETARFYTLLAGMAESDLMKRAFEGFAREEEGHKEKLLGIKEDKSLVPAQTEILEMQVEEYLPDVKPGPDISYTEALTMAMKGEKAAFRLYSDLASTAQDEGVREILLALAQEEAKHKVRFEIEYESRTVGLAPNPEM